MPDPLIDYWRVYIKLHVPAFVNVDAWPASDIAKGYAALTANGFDGWCEALGVKPREAAEDPEPDAASVAAHNESALSKLRLPEKREESKADKI